MVVTERGYLKIPNFKRLSKMFNIFLLQKINEKTGVTFRISNDDENTVVFKNFEVIQNKLDHSITIISPDGFSTKITNNTTGAIRALNQLILRS